MTTTTHTSHHVSAHAQIRAYLRDDTATPIIALGEDIHIFLNRYPDTLAESAEFVRRLVLAGEDLLEQIELRLQAEQPSEVCS